MSLWRGEEEERREMRWLSDMRFNIMILPLDISAN